MITQNSELPLRFFEVKDFIATSLPNICLHPQGEKKKIVNSIGATASKEGFCQQKSD